MPALCTEKAGAVKNEYRQQGDNPQPVDVVASRWLGSHNLCSSLATQVRLHACFSDYVGADWAVLIFWD